MSGSGLDKVLADAEAQFKAKFILLQNMLQEAEIKMKADARNAAMKYKEKIQAGKQQLDAREQELKEWEGRLQEEEGCKRDELENESKKLDARYTSLVELGKAVVAAQEVLEGNWKDLLDGQARLNISENRLNEIELELEAQRDLLHIKEEDLERKSKSLEERETALETKEKDLEEIADRECAVTLREEEVRLRVANLQVDVEALKLEDHGWIEANEFISSYDGNTSPEVQQKLLTLLTLIDIAGKAGMIPVLKKSFPVKFEIGLKGKPDEEAASVVTATGVDDLDGISNLVKNLAKYIKAQR